MAEGLIRRRALRIEQPGRPVFQFALTASEILTVADISRIGRNEAEALIGYQRPSVRRHVDEIADYVASADAVFPNAIIMALSSRARFVQSRGPHVSDGLAAGGMIQIPLAGPHDARPAWIVDGQQRALALAKASVAGLAIPVTAFIADDVAFQRDQFVRINNARPLPRGLVTELLPEMSSPLPARLVGRRVPSLLCDALNRSEGSAFFGLISRPSTATRERASAVVTDTALVQMIQERLDRGCLFPYRDATTGETDAEAVWLLLHAFWSGARSTFPDAWGLPPSQSRLMHSVGILSMGRLMDEVMRGMSPRDPGLHRQVERELAVVAPVCRWTSGRWDGINGVEWNGLENTSRDRRLLANLLVRTYVQRKASAA